MNIHEDKIYFQVVDFHHPHQLREMMAHCLDLDESPQDLEQLLSDCKETLKYCAKTGQLRERERERDSEREGRRVEQTLEREKRVGYADLARVICFIQEG